MKNIIFTWELGGGSGHISEMMPLAKKFDDQQYHVSLLLKDVIDELGKFDGKWY